MKKFKIEHILFRHKDSMFFTEDTAPEWLTSKNTVKGSTMDNRWFWDEHVMILKVGEYLETDFNRITRVE